MSAKLMKSKFVRRPSVRGIDYLWSYCMDCFQISFVASPGPYAQKIFDFLGIFFVFVNMGPYGSQNFKTLLLPQISFESFQTFFWNFFSVVLTKVLFWIFEIWSFRFFNEFFIFTFATYGETKPSSTWKTNDRRSNQIEIWASGVSIHCTHGTIYTKYWPPRLKFHSVSFYDQSFSRYRLVENRNMPNDLRMSIIT